MKNAREESLKRGEIRQREGAPKIQRPSEPEVPREGGRKERDLKIDTAA